MPRLPRVHAARPSMFSPSSPPSGRHQLRPVRFLNVAVGLLALAAVLIGNATASAELTPGDGLQPPPPPVSVGHVFAVGDCIMLGATPDIQQAIGDVEIDAAVSRQASTGIEILRARQAAGQLPDVVVFHLGTNGPVSR